jgi:hypothetical protein
MDKPWDKPDLNDVWEIEDISNPNQFMRFILKAAPIGSTWVINSVWQQETIELLQTVTPKEIKSQKVLGIFIRPAGEIEIPLTEKAKEKLDAMVSCFDLKTEFTEHHVYDGQQMIMISYDNLAPCWLSKAFTEEMLQKASIEVGFRYFDLRNA